MKLKDLNVGDCFQLPHGVCSYHFVGFFLFGGKLVCVCALYFSDDYDSDSIYGSYLFIKPDTEVALL